MGKALLVIVLGSGLILTKQLYNASQNERETSKDQTAYQEEVIAREIAQSAFNVGMGEVRSYGERVQAGVRALNGPSNEGRSGTHTTGRFAGGAYTVKAHLTSGHSVRVEATGTFGEAEFTMHDEYRIPVLTARHDGLVRVRFLESMAGYCSAVFYQAYTLDMAPGTVPTPVMLFAPDKNRTAPKPTQTIYVEAGTQMNFFIGVDKNCSERRVETETNTCSVRSYAQSYTYNPAHFDWVHHALEVEAGSLDQATEAVWSMVEQSPVDRQRWRIAWEDLDYPQWDNRESDDPMESLQALKRLGYGGLGWTAPSESAYGTLKDYYLRPGKSNNGHWSSYRPDFSDQVIEIEVIAANDPEYSVAQAEELAQQVACGEPIDQPVAPVREEDVTPPVEEAADDAGVDLTPDLTDDTPTSSYSDDELTEFACGCTNYGKKANKTAILHRPPGNESNEQLICIGTPAVGPHFDNHNDIFPTCNVRRNVKANNKK